MTARDNWPPHDWPHRTPRVIGGHDANDGGFSMTEPTPAERDRTAGWVLATQAANELWLRAAERLTQVCNLVALCGANLVVEHELRHAEEQYDMAKAMAQAAIEQATTHLPEVRANQPGRHRDGGF